MSNDEPKKKIAQIIADYFCPQRNEHKNLWGDDRLCYSKMNFAECERVAECTDALIAAGIGDVKEEERRAEVAERALKEFAVQVCCEDCPFWEGCNYSEPIPTNDFQCCFDMYLQEAEIKLAKEERKND